MKQNKILIIVLIVSILVNVLLGISYFQNQNTKNSVDQVSITEKARITEFTKFVINKVVATGGKMNFEDRAKIQEDLIALNDQQISEKWDKFVASQSAEEAQASVVDLLITLTEKNGTIN
jgi:hypothetical protein